jgi:transposase
VFVRQVSMAEGQRLQRISRTAKDPVKLRRAIVVLMSAQGQPAPDIAHLLAVTEDYVRDVIHAFNQRGFDALNPKWSGGAPRRIDEQTRDWICVIARCDPRFLDRPFACWSLAKLRDYLIEAGYVTTISVETVRRILHERGVTWQASKTWKASTDPDFTAKMRRILDLYDHRPAGGRVICVDEFGPLNLQPRPGRAWRPAGRPVRLRATYTRDHGVRHMIAALDLATGRLHYRTRDRKRWREFLAFCKSLRRRWPDDKLVPNLRQLLPAQAPRGPRLVRGQPRRAGVPTDVRVLAELDRGRVRRRALLRPQRHRPPQPRRAGRRHRRLHPLAQPTRQNQNRIRRRLQDPPSGLPIQGCMTRH